MTTSVLSNNKIYQTLEFGEINILKDVSLREISMKIYLPNDISIPFVQKPYSYNCIIDKPIIYLNKFREFKSKKKPLRLMINRILQSGEELFKTNIKVSLEDYTIFERAGEEGDFWVKLIFKEFREDYSKQITLNSNGKYIASIDRPKKETSKKYIVKQGDTLWQIAKRELNNELLYKEIAKLNNISQPRKLQIGTVLKLP